MAPAKRVKVKETEKLSEANIQRVISLLEQPKPITKKEACEILNIAYNTTRLGTIITNYKSRKELDEKRRAANRGKPASDHEIVEVITDYLNGEPVSTIADQLYRSTTFVRNILDTVGVPQRQTGENYMDFSPLPEQCISDTFEVGEIAWSCRFQSPCYIEQDKGMTSDGSAKLYRIYVIERKFDEPEVKYFAKWGKPGFYSYQPAYDLGKLSHLKAFGIDVERNLTR
jgi:hypothetical protein